MRKKIELIMAVCLILTALFAATHGVRDAVSGRAVEGMKVMIGRRSRGEMIRGKVAADGSLEKDINLEDRALSGGLSGEEGDGCLLYPSEGYGGCTARGSTSKKSEDLKKRCEIIEDIDPDITISIHQNSYQESYVKGAQVFYYSQSVQGKALAEALQENLRKYADRENTRKAKANDSYYILKNTVSPTVIVECGFLSNPKEAEKLQESSYQEKLAEAIYHGICDFLEENSGEDSREGRRL